MAFRNGSIGVDDALKRIQLGAQGFRDTIKDPAVLLGGDLKGLGDAFLKISTATMDSSAATAQQRAEADRLTKSLAEFNESAKRLKTGFESIQTAVFAGLGNAFSGFINGTNTAFIGYQQCYNIIHTIGSGCNSRIVSGRVGGQISI
jgi:hypothetical protein